MSTTPKYQSEIVSLPSQGKLYNENHPLSKGEIELKYMTAEEEDILTSKNLIVRGVVFDRLLQSVIIDQSINVNDLILGDKNGMLFATRIMGYGSKYPAEVTCKHCDQKHKETFDLQKLSTITPKEDPDDYSKVDVNSFETTLPKSDRLVKFKILNGYDDEKIDEMLKGLKKVEPDKSHEVTTRLTYTITEIEGMTDKSKIYAIVKKMLSIDSLYLREMIRDAAPDIDMSYDFICPNCSKESEIQIPLDSEFFWPSGKR